MEKQLRLTVITVVYNASDRIRATIESVIGQDYENIEYIIKDGGSTDGTLCIINDYADRYANISFITGEDRGIYDAMNIALEHATGDVVEFLNSGDRFAASDVVSRAMIAMMNTGSDIVYGDIMYENSDGTTDIRKYPQACSSRFYYLTGDCINHQCMFARKELFGGCGFDSSFKICGDREWMLRAGAYSPKSKMTALEFVVAVYPLDGVSVNNKALYKSEAALCLKRHLPLGYPVYVMFELVRSNYVLAKILHFFYKRMYIRR